MMDRTELVEAADRIEREMRDGFLHAGVVAPESRAAGMLRTLIAAARELAGQEGDQ